MTKYRWLTVVVVMLIALLVAPVPASSAQATFTGCEAELNLVDFEEGTVTFHGTNMHIRGRFIQFEQTSDNPLCSGTINVVANYNVGKDGSGPKWGTFTWEALPDGPYTGGFQGTFTGWSEEYSWSSSVNAVGQGYGELKEVHLEEYIDFPTPFHGDATLTILDPHGE